MKSFAVLALSAVALAAPLKEKRDYVYDTVIETAYETVYTTTTLWVDPTPEPVSTAAAFFEQPKHSAPVAAQAPAFSAPAAPAAAPSAPQAPPQQAAPVASPTSTYTPPAVQTPPAVAPPQQPAAPAAPASTWAPAAPAAPAASPAAPANSGSGSSSSGSSSGATQGDHIGDITYYDVSVGTGSCGTTASNSDNVVALSHLDMNNGANPNANPLCGKMINIYYQGSTHQARVFDTCPTCAEGSLDLTESLFKAVAPNGDGRVHEVSWSFA